MTFSTDVKTLSLRLLEREPPSGPVVSPESYAPQSLTGLIERLSRPDEPLTGSALCSLCLKYFFAYLYPESCDVTVPLDTVTILAGQFVRRRGGCRTLTGREELCRTLLHHGFALQMLRDLPKTAHLLAVLAGHPLERGEDGFLGLDLGAGTGILLVGQYLLARRGGQVAPVLIGIEHLPQVARRADVLLSHLGIGRVHQGDATKATVYEVLPAGMLSCVTNETLPSSGRRLFKEPFTAINAALFTALGPRLGETAFLPEAVWASDRTGMVWRRLSPDNAFTGGAGNAAAAEGKPLRLFFMRDVELAGVRLPVERVGSPWLDLVCPPWRQALSHRW